MPSAIVVQPSLERRGAAAAGRAPGRPPRCSAGTASLRVCGAVPVAVLLGLAAFVVYLRTLSVSISWGDSPELTAAAYYAGVAHPTGYPLYTMLAHAFIHLFPVGSVAYRMNLLSAISGALAVALIYPLMLRISRSRLASLVATLIFAYSQTFWSQTVIAEVYAFHLLTMAAVLGCLTTWDARGDRRWLLATATVYGLCLTHHMMSALMAPALLFFALTSRHRPQFLRELRWILPLFLLPLSLYVYLPLAALRGSPIDWGDPRNWHNFMAHVTGRQYQHGMFTLTGAQLWAHWCRYTGWGVSGGSGFLERQFSAGFLWLAPLGAGSLARRHWRLFGLTVLIYLVSVIFALNYQIIDVEIYYLPSHLMVAVWIACGLRRLGIWLALAWRYLGVAPARRRLINLALASSLFAMPLTLLMANWSLNDHHDDWSALMYARAALAALKPNAFLITDGDNHYFPMLYARYVENRRPDVTLLACYDFFVDPEYATKRLAAAGLVPPSDPCLRPGRKQPGAYTRLLRRMVDTNMGRRPIYVQGPPEVLQDPWLAQAIGPYCRLVDSNLPRVELVRRPPHLQESFARPHRETAVIFSAPRPDGGRRPALELLGYDVDPVRGEGAPLFRISYCWRVSQPEAVRRARVWVLFTDAAGNYQKQPDGSPMCHNIHPLAYGSRSASSPLPPTLRETYTVYVQPSEWNKRLHARLAVELNGRFLLAGDHRDPWVDLGELPFTAAGDSLHRLASAGPLRPTE